jgi:hypothetical protein
MNWDRIVMGNAMSGHVLVVAYMSDPIPRISPISFILSLVEGDWSVDRIAPAFIGIGVDFAS